MNKIRKILGAFMLLGTITSNVTQLSAKSEVEIKESNSIIADYCSAGAVSDYVDKYLVRLEKTAPSIVPLEEDYSYNYIITAKDKLKKVVVEEQIPDGTTYVSSNPTAQIDENTVTWTLYNLEEGEIVPLELVVNASTVSDFSNCATIVAYPEACTTTSVGVPTLTIKKTTPEDSVLINKEVPWNIVVTNTGNLCARDVVITDALPTGFIHESGESNLVTEIGILTPGEVRQISLSATATEAGEHCNVAVVTASNAEPVQDDACIVVLKPSLELTKEGPEKQFVNKKAVYTITAKNTGNIPFSDIIISDEIPSANKLITAAGAEVNGNTAVWETSLAAGEEKSFELTVLGVEEGSYCNEVSIVTNEHNLSGSDSVCTEWSGYPALLIEVIDTEDPLLVGEETTYIVQIINQGTAPDTNVTVDVQLPSGLSIESAAGDTPGTIDGNNIVFAPYPVLNAKERIQYRVVAKAIAEGDSRFKVQVKSDLLEVPVPEEESTQVY